MKHIKILLWLAVAAPLLALWPSFQDPFDQDVERACTASRYGLRLAAGRKVAAAGAAAVPAIRRFAAKNGKDAVASNLVEAIADATTTDAAVVDLLRDWASDRDFFWRGQAMRGLASRAPELPDRRAALEALFRDHAADPAWLTRTHARFGLALLGDDAVLGIPDEDPRVVPRLSWLLLARGRTVPLQPLLDAIGEERTFLGIPWGTLLGKDAHKGLRDWLGPDHPLPPGESFADKESALKLLTEAARKKSGQELRVPAIRADGPTAFVGGFELLSCKNGDLHVQWTAAGALHFGIDAAQRVEIPSARWQQLCKDRAVLQLEAAHGVVICDSLNLLWTEPKVQSKIAPESLPPAAADWLKQLAAAIEEAGAPALAERLRRGIGQFAPR